VVKHNQNKKTQLRILDVLDSKTEPSIANGVESQTPTLGCKKTFETSLPAETSIQSQQYPVPFNFPLCTNLNSNLGSNLALPLAEPAKQSSRLCAEIQEGNVLPRTVQNSNGTAAARFLEPVLPFALCPEKVRAPAASPSTANSLGVIKKSLTILGNVAEANNLNSLLGQYLNLQTSLLTLRVRQRKISQLMSKFCSRDLMKNCFLEIIKKSVLGLLFAFVRPFLRSSTVQNILFPFHYRGNCCIAA